ncbi:serine hydrolase domain-containing protein [Novosphingobium sp. BL-52-GroH]|uniref:serine hydrolase domain-containing protein n=1 Tax=Novosphingobium sp. BL-52-GroH TaxID=3349877 RepID=UPI00384AAE2E
MRQIQSALTFGIVACAILSFPCGALAQGKAVKSDDPGLKTGDISGSSPQPAQFSVPDGWSVERREEATILRPAEQTNFIAIVEVGAQPDAAVAAAAAWKVLGPTQPWPVRLVSNRAGRDGWEASAIVDYQVPPSLHTVVVAAPHLSKGRWTVLIQSSAEDVAERRGAAFGSVWDTLQPAGYVRESFAGRNAHKLDAKRVHTIKAFVSDAMKRLEIPGVALALIQNKKIVYEGGFGVREVGRSDQINMHTRFLVASNTKGMTTLLLAKLVDEGRLSWDQPVASAYADFRLGDPDLTSKVLVRQLVCACTGLPRRDFEWAFGRSRETPASIVFSELATTNPTSGFGSTFQYSNTLAAAAGYVAGHVLYPDKEIGTAYDRAMQDKVFRPLGMTDTTFSTDIALSGDHASPHGENLRGSTVPADLAFEYLIAPYRPAGGAWSSAHDMALYVRNELLTGASPEGPSLFSRTNMLERRKPGVPIGKNSRYGLGLVEDTSWGVPVYHHGGGMPGYQTDLLFIPDAGIGAVLLTNSNSGSRMVAPFMRRLLEVLYDCIPQAEGDLASAATMRLGQLRQLRADLTTPPDDGHLGREYISPELGRIIVRSVDERRIFQFPGWESEVASKRNSDGTTSYVTIAPANSGYEFTANPGPGAQPLVIRDGQHEYRYTNTKD